MENIADYIYGLAKLNHEEKSLGYVTEDGVDWGGESAQKRQVFAAQIKSAPVLSRVTKKATNILKFKMFQLNGDNCKAVMGGSTNAKGSYLPPEDIPTIAGKFDIETDSGHTIRIYNGQLNGDVRGKINGADELGIDCELEMLRPANNGRAYMIFAPGDTVPDIKTDTAPITDLVNTPS